VGLARGSCGLVCCNMWCVRSVLWCAGLQVVWVGALWYLVCVIAVELCLLAGRVVSRVAITGVCDCCCVVAGRVVCRVVMFGVCRHCFVVLANESCGLARVCSCCCVVLAGGSCRLTRCGIWCAQCCCCVVSACGSCDLARCTILCVSLPFYNGGWHILWFGVL